jgi:c-di-AMP phosphodiesterase-like protein
MKSYHKFKTVTEESDHDNLGLLKQDITGMKKRKVRNNIQSELESVDQHYQKMFRRKSQ